MRFFLSINPSITTLSGCFSMAADCEWLDGKSEVELLLSLSPNTRPPEDGSESTVAQLDHDEWEPGHALVLVARHAATASVRRPSVHADRRPDSAQLPRTRSESLLLSVFPKSSRELTIPRSADDPRFRGIGTSSHKASARPAPRHPTTNRGSPLIKLGRRSCPPRARGGGGGARRTEP